MKKIWIGMLACMVVAGCSNEENNQSGTENEAQAEKSDASSTNPYTFSADGQSFEIVPMYDEFLNYAADMKEDPSDNKETFEETVIQPMQKEMKEIDLTSGPRGPKPIFRTTQQFDLLKDKTNQLADQQDHFNKLLKEALTQSAEQLQGDDVSVYLMPYMPEEDAQKKELFAVTAPEGNIMVKMSPSLTDKSLQSVIAHEYHHTVTKDYNTLLGTALVEGKADYFANTLYPSRKSRDDLSEEEEKNILKLLDDKARTSVPSKAYETLHKGSDEKGIPPRAMYTIGMKILENHLKNNPDESIKDWTDKPSEKIVKESDYSELLEKTDIVESSAD